MRALGGCVRHMLVREPESYRPRQPDPLQRGGLHCPLDTIGCYLVVSPASRTGLSLGLTTLQASGTAEGGVRGLGTKNGPNSVPCFISLRCTGVGEERVCPSPPFRNESQSKALPMPSARHLAAVESVPTVRRPRGEEEREDGVEGAIAGGDEGVHRHAGDRSHGPERIVPGPRGRGHRGLPFLGHGGTASGLLRGGSHGLFEVTVRDGPHRDSDDHGHHQREQERAVLQHTADGEVLHPRVLVGGMGQQAPDRGAEDVAHAPCDGQQPHPKRNGLWGADFGDGGLQEQRRPGASQARSGGLGQRLAYRRSTACGTPPPPR